MTPVLSIFPDSYTTAAMLQPGPPALDVCLFHTEPDRTYPTSPSHSYFLSDTMAIDTTSTPPVTTPITPAACGTTCVGYILDIQSNAYYPTSSFTYNVASTGGSVTITNTAITGTYSVLMRGVLPTSYMTACMYYFQLMTLQVTYVTIIPTTISSINYDISYPSTTVTVTAFTVSPATATASRFTILYALTDNLGDPLPAAIVPVITFSGLTLTVYTNDFTTAGTYSLAIKAYFTSYNPTYYVLSTFTLTLINLCGPNIVTACTFPSALYYMINDPPLVYNWTPWTSSVSICVPIVYSLSA